MANVANAESADKRARVKFERWRRKFEEEWERPLVASVWNVFWQQVPKEEQKKLKADYPDGYNYIQKMISGG